MTAVVTLVPLRLIYSDFKFMELTILVIVLTGNVLSFADYKNGNRKRGIVGIIINLTSILFSFCCASVAIAIAAYHD